MRLWFFRGLLAILSALFVPVLLAWMSPGLIAWIDPPQLPFKALLITQREFPEHFHLQGYEDWFNEGIPEGGIPLGPSSCPKQGLDVETDVRGLPRRYYSFGKEGRRVDAPGYTHVRLQVGQDGRCWLQTWGPETGVEEWCYACGEAVLRPLVAVKWRAGLFPMMGWRSHGLAAVLGLVLGVGIRRRPFRKAKP